MKRWMQAAVVVIVTGLLAGAACQSAKSMDGREPAAEIQLEHTDLKICLIGARPKDADIVLEQLNQMTERDLNCSVDIEWIGWGDFSMKYPMVLSTGGGVDLVYAANWLDFFENAQRGAFAPLDELLEQYAPESLAELTDSAREQATVNGFLYALPANYTNYNVLGAIVRGDLMDKYHIESIDSFSDYLNFCDVIAAGEKMDPTGMCSTNTDMINMYLMSEGYYPLTGSTSSPYWIDLKDNSYPVYFQSECPAAERFLSKAQEWYKKGYWTSVVLASKDETLLDSGLAASRIHNYDAYLGEYGINLDKKLRYYNLADPIVLQKALQDAMAVSAFSRNKERAVMLLEKFRNEEDYYMLVTYGLEGYHYKRTGRRIEFLNNDYGNEPGTWGFREEKFKCQDSVLPDEALHMKKEYEERALDTPLVNFNLNLDPIREEYDRIKEVMSDYYYPLKLGYIDYQEGKKQLEEKLLEAQNEKVKKEIQRQLREFLRR